MRIRVLLVPLALLGLSTNLAYGQATDLVCSNCVQASDMAAKAVTTNKLGNSAVVTDKIAAGAVTTNKIGDGAVSRSKIRAGAVATGKIQDGAVTGEKLAAGAFLYYPYGPQVNIPESRLTGWEECYQDVYTNSDVTLISDILAACNRDKLLMACRPVGSGAFNVLAAGRRVDVLTDTTSDTTTTHNWNGVGWYFHQPDKSWGFVRAGDVVSKSSCDTNTAGTDDEKMCWHIFGDTIGFGYRCGTNRSLNGNPDWERLIYHAD